ncbi:MAG: RHS repeat-associated core domain-containing protein [Chitinophagaceae bacterium]|nr:MAG: RHS repeat-associated core domain-containing protein [Chitinophagaceae bacterium]
MGNLTTVYVRDASGNVMSVYEKLGVLPIKQTELHLYGSSRLGIAGALTNAPVTVSLGSFAGRMNTLTRGEKLFELSNHLGNVLVTVSDKRVALNISTKVDSYEPDLRSASDYAPFGMQLVGRKWSAGEYRYGFNGKENDNEVKGDSNQQDYGMRIYDTRLGRFLSVDPITRSYPELTPYQFASNRPIDGIDLDGLEYMKGKISVYGLNKFQVATTYQEGAIEIRDMEIHKIVMHHPRYLVKDRLPEDDDGVPEVAMVKQRSSSNRAQQRQASETKDAARNMSGDILGGIIAAIEFGYSTYYNEKYKDELALGSESVYALNSADILTRAAYNSKGFPEIFKQSQGNKATTDLANYLTDGTTPSDGNISYSMAIAAWGDLIFQNKEKVLEKKFDFSPETTLFKTKTITTNGGEVRQEIKYTEKVGNSDPSVIRANKMLEKVVVPPATTVRSSN